MLLFLFQACGTRGEESSGRCSYFPFPPFPRPSSLFSLAGSLPPPLPSPRANTDPARALLCHTTALPEDNGIPEQLGDALFWDSEAITCIQLASSRDAEQWFERSFSGKMMYLPSGSEGLLAGNFLDHPNSLPVVAF